MDIFSNPMEKKSYFIVSKPLQYINATNIAEDAQKVCVFINNMANGLSIYNELKRKSNHWDGFLYFENRMDALREMVKRARAIKALYVDSDYGLVIQYQLHKIKAAIYVYEEGLGTYTSTRRKNSLPDQIIGLFSGLLGNEDYIGGYKHTKGVYLYDQDRHKITMTSFCKARLKFNKPFLAHLQALPEVDIFFPTAAKEKLQGLKNKKVAVYLAPWAISLRGLDKLRSFQNHIKVLKPHPHQKNIPHDQDVDIVVDAYIMVELLLLHLLANCKEVVVIHQGSSFAQYIGNHENLILIEV